LGPQDKTRLSTVGSGGVELFADVLGIALGEDPADCRAISAGPLVTWLLER